jgi:hypothetical protein
VAITKTYTSGTFGDEVQSIKRPDGTMDFYEYATNAEGIRRTNTVYSGQPSAQQTAIINGTKTVTILALALTRIDIFCSFKVSIGVVIWG